MSSAGRTLASATLASALSAAGHTTTLAVTATLSTTTVAAAIAVILLATTALPSTLPLHPVLHPLHCRHHHPRRNLELEQEASADEAMRTLRGWFTEALL